MAVHEAQADRRCILDAAPAAVQVVPAQSFFASPDEVSEPAVLCQVSKPPPPAASTTTPQCM